MPMTSVPAVLTLVSDTDTITLRPAQASGADPIVCSAWDLGAPAVRESVVDRPGADGTIDRTQFAGSRSVSFDLAVFGDGSGSAYAYLERLAAMTHPGVRPRLRIQRDSPEATGQTWEMVLRGNPYSLSYGKMAAAKLDLQLQFTAPLGFLEGDLQEAQTVLADPSVVTGIVFPITFPLSTGNTSAANPIITITVGGSAPIAPVFRIFGPATAPEITDNLGQRFKMTGLVLAASNYVDIDMSAATVRINGDPAQSAYETVDFSVSTFWTWKPGVHTVRYVASSGSLLAQWRDRRYSI